MTRYPLIDKQLFVQNRANFAKAQKSNTIALFNANDLMPTNADGTMPFRQNNDLFYLTGVDQEETILLIYPDAPEDKFKEILFLRETNEEIAIWEGNKLTKEQAREVTGIQEIRWLGEFHNTLHTLASCCEGFYLNTNEHHRAEIKVESRDARFIKWCKSMYPLHSYYRSAPVMQQLRAVKSQIEIDLMQEACNITEKGFRRVLSFVKPGVMEYEIEAEYSHEFLKNRSRGFAYTPIIASGANACVLHYIDNAQPCKEGDLLLMDVAAEYANYAADMTRTIPVSGKFTARQRQVYQAVRRVMLQAIDILKVGNIWNEYHEAVGEFMTKELVDLGLLTMDQVNNQSKEKPAYKKYFMHGTSHHLGLDVHDLGDRYRRFTSGMVFTCEPGIYIREENIGIRLENDILITKSGNQDLMKNIPIEAEEIEELMNKL